MRFRPRPSTSSCWYKLYPMVHPTCSLRRMSGSDRTHTVFSLCASICSAIPSSQVAAILRVSECTHCCLFGWPLGLVREEEDFGITVGAPATFRSCYSVIAIWVNNVLCLSIPDLAVGSSVSICLPVPDAASLSLSQWGFVCFTHGPYPHYTMGQATPLGFCSP